MFKGRFITRKANWEAVACFSEQSAREEKPKAEEQQAQWTTDHNLDSCDSIDSWFRFLTTDVTDNTDFGGRLDENRGTLSVIIGAMRGWTPDKQWSVILTAVCSSPFPICKAPRHRSQFPLELQSGECTRRVTGVKNLLRSVWFSGYNRKGTVFHGGEAVNGGTVAGSRTDGD